MIGSSSCSRQSAEILPIPIGLGVSSNFSSAAARTGDRRIRASTHGGRGMGLRAADQLARIHMIGRNAVVRWQGVGTDSAA
jgi:hypothetical protein